MIELAESEVAGEIGLYERGVKNVTPKYKGIFILHFVRIVSSWIG
jgi:hypothetical protein